jgi:hypothetical protein
MGTHPMHRASLTEATHSMLLLCYANKATSPLHMMRTVCWCKATMLAGRQLLLWVKVHGDSFQAPALLRGTAYSMLLPC